MAPTIAERIEKRIDVFEKMVEHFEGRTKSCALYGIKRDIIEIENITRDIDKYIKDPTLNPKSFSKYNKSLNKYDGIIKILEKECKCRRKPKL